MNREEQEDNTNSSCNDISKSAVGVPSTAATTTTTDGQIGAETDDNSSKNNSKGANVATSKTTVDGGTEISANERQKEQRKSLDALYAAAREEFDLDMSPLDSALKTLREGREIQKLSVLRNLVELVEGEPEDAMHRLLPMIQQGVLAVEPSNLDMHCEAAVAYKNCIKEKKLQQKWPELSDRFLVAILENIEAQKENVTATAWLESLVDIADCVSMQSVVEMVVPLVVAQADAAKRIQRRVISTRLIEKLAVLVPKEILQRELSPCAQMLCQDPSAAVRTSIAQKLAVLAQSFNSATDCCTLLLPCIIQLCKDDDPAVREAILGAMALCLPHFGKDAKKSVLLPLLRKCTDQALILRDATLPIIARHFGPWLQCLRDILTPAELRWWLDTYVRILDFSWQQQNANGSGTLQRQPKQVSVENGTQTSSMTPNGQQQKQQQLGVACRRMCAYNFPCFVAVFGDDLDVFSGRLLPILEQLCRDSDDEVRSTIASGFHEIVAQRKMVPAPPPPATTKNGTTTTSTKNVPLPSSSSASSISSAPVPLLLGPFVDLLSSDNIDIVQQLTANLDRILPLLYAEISASGPKKRTRLIFAKLDNILMSCNSLMKGSGSWRAHEAYLNGIAVLRNLIRPKDLLSNFVPLLKQEVLNARALPCRIAAAQTLLLMMREFGTSSARQTIIDFFVRDIGQHVSCYRRRILLDIVPLLLQHFSREFFIDKFLPAVLTLCTDPISNIRLQLCRTLPKIKQYLVFPNNDESLSSLERVVRELLASEQNLLSRQLIQQSACELSRTEADKKECRSNRAKLAEEKRLWTEMTTDESADEEGADEQQQCPSKCADGKTNGIGTAGAAGGSTESGIFFEEDWRMAGSTNGTVATTAAGSSNNNNNNGTTTSSSWTPQNKHRQKQSAVPATRGLCRSATTTGIPDQVEAEVARRRPPPPPPKSWRTTTTIRSTTTTNGGPKQLAIVRPQPQVKVVNQRSCSPMPFDVGGGELLKPLALLSPPAGTPAAAAGKSKLLLVDVAKANASADDRRSADYRDQQRIGRNADKAAAASASAERARQSRLPLSTGRYRSSSSAPIPPPKPKLPLFNASSVPPPSPPSHRSTTSSSYTGSSTTAVDLGTTSVTDSVKMKKYRPRDITTTTTMTTRKCSLPTSGAGGGGSSTTTATNGATFRGTSSIRSASAVPTGSGHTVASTTSGSITSRSRSPAAATVSRTASSRSRGLSPALPMGAVPLQTSASAVSIPPKTGTSTIMARSGGAASSSAAAVAGANGVGPRRPYGLMRVQSTSNAVERRPAQMSIKVINNLT